MSKRKKPRLYVYNAFLKLWWLAEVCMKGAFSGEFFALLPGVEKKQQEIESANCENRNPWPRLPPERLFSVAFFFLWVSTSIYYSFSIFTVFSPRCTQKAKVHEQGNCLGVAKLHNLI